MPVVGPRSELPLSYREWGHKGTTKAIPLQGNATNRAPVAGRKADKVVGDREISMQMELFTRTGDLKTIAPKGRQVPQEGNLYWVEGRWFVCGVLSNGSGIITFTPPLLRKFIGQPLVNLRRWKEVLGVEIIKEEEWNAK